MNLAKTRINRTVECREIPLKFDVRANLSNFWFAPIANGVGLKTELKIKDRFVEIETKFTREARVFLISLFLLTFFLGIGYISSLTIEGPGTFHLPDIFQAILYGTVILSIFGMGIKYLADIQNAATEKMVRRKMELR